MHKGDEPCRIIAHSWALMSIKIRIAVADAGRTGEVRFWGEIANTPDAVASMLRKLGGRHPRMHFVYEAGPCGYGLHRQITATQHHCEVVSPAQTPRKPGDRIKTDRRDAIILARLSRAGELTSVWVPDTIHEAMRDLIRLRQAMVKDLRAARQRTKSFLLRHGRVFKGTSQRHLPKAPPGSAATESGSAIKALHIRRSRLRSRVT